MNKVGPSLQPLTPSSHTVTVLVKSDEGSEVEAADRSDTVGGGPVFSCVGMIYVPRPPCTLGLLGAGLAW